MTARVKYPTTTGPLARIALVGPAATLTISTAADTAATTTIQLRRSSSPAIQMPSAAAKTTLATFAAGTQPIQTKSAAHGRAATEIRGSRRPSALSGSIDHTSVATAASTTADESMMLIRTGSTGRKRLPHPHASSTTTATAGGRKRFTTQTAAGAVLVSTAGYCRTTRRAGGRRARSRP